MNLKGVHPDLLLTWGSENSDNQIDLGRKGPVRTKIKIGDPVPGETDIQRSPNTGHIDYH